MHSISAPSPTMSITDKFKDLVSNAKHLRSNIGVHTAHVNTILQDITADPDIPTQEERTHAEEQAKGQYLAVMFLINSDRKHYSTLIWDIENEYTRGSDTYPATLSAAYDFIFNYHADKRTNTKINEGGMAFYTRDYDNNLGCGCSGRGHGSG